MLNKFVNLNFPESTLRRENFHPAFSSHFSTRSHPPPAFQPRPVHVIRYALARIITNLHTKCVTLILLGGSGGQPRAGNTRRRCLRCARTRIDRLYDAIASYVYLCGARARAHVRMHHRDETPLTPICLPSSRMIQLQATTSTSCTTSSYTQSFAYAQPRDHISA